MRSITRRRSAALAALVALASTPGCSGLDQPSGADLVPVAASPELGRIGFCNPGDDGTLNVTIANRGAAGAAATAVAVVVVFEPPSIRPGRLTALRAGAEARVAVAMPSDCFNPDCDFEIFVDPLDEVAETDETNNHASGRCIGS